MTFRDAGIASRLPRHDSAVLPRQLPRAASALDEFAELMSNRIYARRRSMPGEYSRDADRPYYARNAYRDFISPTKATPLP